MKKVLFASTATAALAFGGMASAQGIALFGDARLGLGYNILNNGDVNYNDDGDVDDDLRAVSRVRFGVRMTGETNSGITFGATIRADNAGNGQGGSAGQSAGSVFVSGAFGTLTYGDTNGADEQHVGDLPEVGLTGLTFFNETIYFTNGGGFGDDDQEFAALGDKRPTVRYDYDIAGFGLSASTDRDLSDISVGGSYTLDFGGGSVDIGAGWADVSNPAGSDIEQWSVGLGGAFGDFGLKAIYTTASAGDSDLDSLGVGGTFGFNEWTVLAYYREFIEGSGAADVFDGENAYGLGVTYDLGGGAEIVGGVARSFGGFGFDADGDNIIDGTVDQATVADFGIRMAF